MNATLEIGAAQIWNTTRNLIFTVVASSLIAHLNFLDQGNPKNVKTVTILLKSS